MGGNIAHIYLQVLCSRAELVPGSANGIFNAIQVQGFQGFKDCDLN